MNKKAENREWEKEAPALAALPKTMPYRVPANYFEELGAQIQTKIAVEQMKAHVSGTAFTTPPHYFEELNARILSKTTGNPSAPKITKLWHTDLIKYASAACFILITASALYFNQQNAVKQNTGTELASEQMLLDIDENVIIHYLDASNHSDSKKITQEETELYILNNFNAYDIASNL